ncbi:unnamed protein product, partial [Symbiodinium necroappetens]
AEWPRPRAPVSSWPRSWRRRSRRWRHSGPGCAGPKRQRRSSDAAVPPRRPRVLGASEVPKKKRRSIAKPTTSCGSCSTPCCRWVGDTRRFGRHLQAISTHNGGLPSMLTYVPEVCLTWRTSRLRPSSNRRKE